MAGGIQKGTEASTPESRQLDGDVAQVAEAISRVAVKLCWESGHKNLTADCYNEDTREANRVPELADRGITVGCVPDGGMWFSAQRSTAPRSLLAVFEAKHQQDGGNAIERWATNYLFCTALNPQVKYVTFMTGEGAAAGAVLHQYGENMQRILANAEFHYSPNGFSREEIFAVMQTVLDLPFGFDRIQSYLPKQPVTAEQQLAKIMICQQQANLDTTVTELIQDKLSGVWQLINPEDREEAREVARDLVSEGLAAEQIAEELASLYVSTVN